MCNVICLFGIAKNMLLVFIFHTHYNVYYYLFRNNYNDNMLNINTILYNYLN